MRFPIRHMERRLKWTIGESCCRGDTRWAGLSLRSKKPCSGLGVEPDRFGQLCLPLVEGPESVGP